MSLPSPSLRFVRGLQASLVHWQNQTRLLNDEVISCLDPDFSNLVRVVEMALVLVETRPAAAALMEQCFFWVEGVGHVHTWYPLLVRLITLLPTDETVRRFRLLKQQAQFERWQHQLAAAWHTLAQAEQLARQIAHPSAMADVLANQASICHLQRDYQAAEQAGAAALTLCGEADGVIRAAALVTLGQAAQEQGHWEKAEALLLEAIPLCRQSGRTLNTARALKILALTNQAQKKFAAALQYLAEAETLLTGTSHTKDRIALLQNQGAIYHEQGQLAQAEIAFRQADALLQPLAGLWRNKGMIATCLGCVYRDQGQWLQAEHAFQQGITFYQRGGDELLLANGWGNLAKLWQQQGRFAEARTYFEQALALLEKFSHHRWARELQEDYRVRLAGAGY